MNTDDLMAAGNPYPERAVEELALQAESHALMEEIMTTPTKASPEQEPRVRRRLRWIAPVVAAAAVAALVVGAVAIIDPQPERDSPAVADPAAPQADVPPPTAGNLRYVTVDADEWEVTHASRGKQDGAVSWSDGESTLELNWYPAGDHRKYLRDREADDYKKRRADLLGQTGWAFRTRYTDGGGTQWWAEDSAPDDSGSKGDTGKQVLSVETILPSVGDSFLTFRAEVPNRRAYRDLVASLQRVDRRTWLEAIESTVVRQSDAQSFLDEAGRDVPMPPGVTVTPADLELPQYPYEASLAFVNPVMCGWAEEYADGNQSALKILQDSEEWPVMDALTAEGADAALFRSEVERLAEHPNYKGWRGMWGC